jgi:hypothetical protein
MVANAVVMGVLRQVRFEILSGSQGRLAPTFVMVHGRSSQGGRDRSDGGSELLMRRGIDRTMPDQSAGRISAQVVTGFPIILRPDGSKAKTATAVGADIRQNIFDAGPAESAFKRANHRLVGIRRKRCVAVFAGWS